MKHVIVQKQTLLAAAIAVALAFPAPVVVAGAESTLLPFPMVPLHHLARQRGGFIGAEGLTLQLNLNLRQMVYVNDQLVSDIRMNLNDLTTATFTDMEAMRAEVQAQRDAIRSDANSLAQSIGETVDDIAASVVANAPASLSSSAAGTVTDTVAQQQSVGVTSTARPNGQAPSASAAIDAVKSPSSALPASSMQTKNADSSALTPAVAAGVTPHNTHAVSTPVAGSAHTTTAAPVNAAPGSSVGASVTNGVSAARTQAAASSRASETAARAAGADVSATGSSANGTTVSNTAAAPTVTHVTPNNPTLSTSGDALERAVVVQNGPNNRVDMDALRDLRGGTMTIIQNTLNNQSFRHVMEVDVTLSGLRNLRTLELLGGLNLQLRGAGK